jgi:hypothetical protein
MRQCHGAYSCDRVVLGLARFFASANSFLIFQNAVGLITKLIGVTLGMRFSSLCPA